jgi:hypothetical protein
MKPRAATAVCVWILLCCASASADSFYKYRDKTTNRDVFVNRLDQVPKKYRSQAKIVLQTGEDLAGQVDEPKEQTAPVEANPVREVVPPRRLSPPTGDELRRALEGKKLWQDGPSAATAVIDLKLAKNGGQPLSGAEGAAFGHLFITILICGAIAGLFALIAWFVIFVTAIRDGRLWWAVLMFLFWPLAYVYLFLYAGKERALFKIVCSLGMLSPALVGLVGAWRFYAWFQGIIQARGGRL